jgi:hypothetical protein
MTNDVQRRVEELLRYYSEVTRRLSHAGVRDVSELLELYDRLCRGLAALSAHEIAWAAELTQGLIDALVAMDGSIDGLRSLKASLNRSLDSVT